MLRSSPFSSTARDSLERRRLAIPQLIHRSRTSLKNEDFRESGRPSLPPLYRCGAARVTAQPFSMQQVSLRPISDPNAHNCWKMFKGNALTTPALDRVRPRMGLEDRMSTVSTISVTHSEREFRSSRYACEEMRLAKFAAALPRI
jgi:hypothetical protein